jgi:TetR/AcrR family transcriptional regulator
VKESGAERSRTTRPDAAETQLRPESVTKLERLLSAAAELMARQGYDQTSIRDVGRETGFSLAGMYYYFKSKEDLLYQIQDRTFSSLLVSQEEIGSQEVRADARLRLLVGNHLAFFDRHQNEMKICTFELQSITGERYQEIEEIRRRYYRIMAATVREILGKEMPRSRRDRLVRHYTLFLFGMLNWVFMWFDGKRDGSVKRLGDEMTDLVLNGLPAAGDTLGSAEESEPA